MALIEGKIILLLLFGLALFVLGSYAQDEQMTTTAKTTSNSTTGTPIVSSGNETRAENGQTHNQEQTETTESPTESHAGAGGSDSAQATGSTTQSGGFFGNGKQSGTTTTGRTEEDAAHTDAPRESGTNNQDGTNSTSAQSDQVSYNAATSENYTYTGRYANSTGTTTQSGVFIGKGEDSNSGTSTTRHTGADVSHTEASQQSGTNNKDGGKEGTERPSTPAVNQEGSAQTQTSGKNDAAHLLTTPKNDEGDSTKYTTEASRDMSGKENDEATTSTNRAAETHQGNQQQQMSTKVPTDHKDPSDEGSNTNAPRQEENNEHAASTPKSTMNERNHTEAPPNEERNIEGDTTTHTAEDTRGIGGKENEEDRTTTSRNEDNHQGNQQKQMTTTVLTDQKDPSNQGSATNAPRQEEGNEDTASTPKSTMNERHHTEGPPDEERHVSVKTTPSSNANEKTSTSAPSSHREERVNTSPRTMFEQRRSTERPHGQEDRERVETTTKGVTEEGEKIMTVGPKVEGSRDPERSTPADNTERNEDRHVTTKPPRDGVKPTQGVGGEGSTHNVSIVYSLPRLALDQSELTLSDEDECTPFTLTFTIPPPREGGIASKPTQSSGTDEESGTHDDHSETTEVISYEDFSGLMNEQFSLPDIPVLLRGKALARNNKIEIDEATFESANQLIVTGNLCDMQSNMLELCLSLDGRTHVRTQDAPTGKCHNFTVYAAAPAISSARLSDTADAVVIFFNKDVNTMNLRNCSSIFNEDTMQLFGRGAECQWRQGKELVVRLRQISTIMTGSPITLRNDRIRAFKQRFSRTSSGTHDLLAPNTPVTPTARIHGEAKVPACGAVRLSARKSTGGGSRGLTYTWSIRSPAEDVDERISGILQEANDANKAGLAFDASLLALSTQYAWGLNVMNIQGLEHSTVFRMRKAAGQEPKFQIRTMGIPEDNSVKLTSRVSLFGEISFDRGPGCPKLNSSLVQFQWTISGAQLEDNGTIQTDRRVLKIPPRTLPGNAEISATLTTTYEAETTMTLTRSVNFTTAFEPLVARIKGGERITTGMGSAPSTLDCSLSKDPNFQGDDPDEGLTFEWGCWQETDKRDCIYTVPDGGEAITLPTTDQGSSAAMLTLDPSMLTAGKVYSFSCNVRKEGFGNKHDSVTVVVTENDPPMISLALLKSKDGTFRPGSDVEIRAIVSGEDISEMNWSDVGGGLDGFGDDEYTNVKDTTKPDEETTISTSNTTDSTKKPYTITIRKKDETYYSLLTIRKGRLEAGSQYEIEFSALNNGEMGTSSVTFNVLAKVTGCQFEFGGNESYVDTATDVKYAVQACSADEGAILTYQAFATFPLDDTRSPLKLLGQTSENPDIEMDHEVLDRVKSRIADGEDVDFQVGVRVCYQDSKICADFKKAVTYVHVPLTAAEVDAKKEEINDLKKEGRPVEGLKTANSAQNAREDDTAGAKRKKRATYTFDLDLLDLQKELLILASGDKSNFDSTEGDIQQMMDLASHVPIQAFPREEIREILHADKGILDSAKDLDERLPQDTLDGVRQHLENAKGAFADRKFFTENREILGLLSKCMSKGLTMDERATSHGTDIRMAIEATLNIDPLLISMGEGDITFNAGDDVRNRYGASWEGCGCEDCVGVLVEFVIYQGADYVAGESHDSDVIGLQFLNPCTGEPLEILDLTDHASMSIPYSSAWPSDTNPVCSYYDMGRMDWMQDGVATFIEGMDVVCKTNHTTDYVIDFVIVDGAVPEPTMTTTEGGEMSTDDDEDDDDGDGDGDVNIPGVNGLLGLGIGVIVGIVVGALVAFAIIIILLAVVIKNLNKPKTIVEPIVKA